MNPGVLLLIVIFPRRSGLGLRLRLRLRAGEGSWVVSTCSCTRIGAMNLHAKEPSPPAPSDGRGWPQGWAFAARSGFGRAGRVRAFPLSAFRFSPDLI